MRSSTGSLLEKPWIAAGWLICFVALLFLYFQWNTPLSRIASNLLPLLLALFFVLSFTGFGAPLAIRFTRGEDKGVQFLTSAALGIGLTGIFIYFLGLFGRLSPALFLSWTLVGFALFVFSLLRWFRPSLRVPSFQLWNALALAILTLFILQGIPSLVAPEVTIDALEFHLLVPRIYLVTKHISYIPGLVESNYPSLAEYNYVLILGLTSDVVCKCFHFWTGMLLLMTIARLSKKTDPQGSSWFASALFLSMPVAAIITGWAWNDLLFAFFVLLGLYFLLNFHLRTGSASPRTSLILAGAMGGLASCTKYTFLMVLIAIAFLFVIGIFLWEWKWKHLFVYLVPVSILSLIWFAKNWVYTGNPFYPFLNHFFGSPYWNQAAEQYFEMTLREYEIGNWDWKMNFLFPFVFALKPRIADVHIGILPLIFAPLALVRTRLPAMGFLKAFVLSYVAAWLGIRTEVRSLLAMLAVLCVIYSVTLQRISWRAEILKVMLFSLLLISISANFFVTTLTTYFLFDPMKHFLGMESNAEYRTRFAKTQPAYDFLNETEGMGKVLLVSIHNPFYLKREPVFSSCCDPPVAERFSAGARDPDEIRNRLLQAGITHIVFNARDYRDDMNGRLYSWPTETRKTFEAFLVRDCKKVAVAGNDVILEIRAP